MNDERQGSHIPTGAPEDDPGAGVSSDSAGAGGMANTMPPAPTAIGVRMGIPAGMGGVRGVTPPGGTTEEGAATGQDVRHRGWYWHWNTLITQYAPLLGLKGVGLLNSYTVWTDRREGSSHQGYAFPTQDAEGKFYGEGREELITLNKILVALDLIAIHKEMVLRQDDRNRRWRVPHNFYRVKDPRDGLVLNLPAVVRVLELANRDKNVFRSVRHIFGAQFAPIDRTSIWHYLLPELRQMTLWQQLAERAERERRGGKKILVLARPEATTTNDTIEITIAANNDIAASTGDEYRDVDAAVIDKGIVVGDDFRPRTDGVARVDAEMAPEMPDVVPSNADRPLIFDEGKTIIEPARRSFVAPTDSMYDQGGESEEETRTRTSTRSTNTRESVSAIFEALAERDERERVNTLGPDTIASPEIGADTASSFLPVQPLPPVPDLPEDSAVIVRALDVTEPPTAAYAQQTATIVDIEAALTMANGRPPSDMEISLLVQVARECDPAAQAQGYGPGTGLGWVLAAIWEAVNSGSQFVAPKRVAAICDRWVIEGFGSDNRANPNAPPPVHTPPPTWPMPTMSGEPPPVAPPVALTDSAPLPILPDIGYASTPPAPTPGTVATEAEARRLWEQVMRRLEGVLHPDALERWFIGARVTVIEHDRVIVAVPGADIALKLASYRGLISRRMSEALGRTVDVVFQATHLSTPPAPPANPVQQSTQVYSPPISETPTPWSWPPPTASGSFPTVPADSTTAPPANPPTEKRESPRAERPTASPRPAERAETLDTPPSPSAPLSTTGLTNRQVWAMALQDLQNRMSGATFAVWVRPAELLTIDADGTVVIGAHNRVQRERLERQHLPDLTIVLGKILDRPVGVRVVMIHEADGQEAGEQRGA